MGVAQAMGQREEILMQRQMAFTPQNLNSNGATSVNCCTNSRQEKGLLTVATKPNHYKLTPYCDNAPKPPHSEAWLKGISQIARQLGTSTQRARKRIETGEIFAITVDGVLYGNRTWCPNTWYACDANNPNDPGYPVPRWLAPPDR